jgi:hypothetical protein
VDSWEVKEIGEKECKEGRKKNRKVRAGREKT